MKLFQRYALHKVNVAWYIFFLMELLMKLFQNCIHNYTEKKYRGFRSSCNSQRKRKSDHMLRCVTCFEIY